MTQEEVRLAYMRSCEIAFESRLLKLYRTSSDHPEDVEFLVEHWDEVVGYLAHPIYADVPRQLQYKVPYACQILEAIDFLCGLVENIRDEGDTCVAYLCLGDGGKTWSCIDEEDALTLLAGGREDVRPVLLMSAGPYDKAVPLARAAQLRAVVSTQQAKKHAKSARAVTALKQELQALLRAAQDGVPR